MVIGIENSVVENGCFHNDTLLEQHVKPINLSIFHCLGVLKTEKYLYRNSRYFYTELS